ncbi:phytanoyl-CoA dioxygenase family protein [Nonomuraea terrae]|uniref:phytanoyl-CoA dioxygenase family protein n=1 Tax=Nonomuraea terrae TaxID=2530383 RepID=UPI0037A50936
MTETTAGTAVIPRLKPPYDPAELDDAVKNRGAVILCDAYTEQECDTLLGQIAEHKRSHPEEWEYTARSMLGTYQGPDTATALHLLVGAIPCAAGMVVHPDILGCARRLLKPLSDTVLLTLTEYIERRPGAPAQGLHRDTVAWPHMPVGEHPIMLTAIAAMTEFTAANGATWVVLDSHGGLASDAAPGWEGAVQAEMNRGDVLLFRADLFHAGGANTTDSDVRHFFSMAYQVAWLRQIENSTLSVPPRVAAELAEDVQELLGYSHELVLGLYKGGDPKNALRVS